MNVFHLEGSQWPYLKRQKRHNHGYLVKSWRGLLNCIIYVDERGKRQEEGEDPTRDIRNDRGLGVSVESTVGVQAAAARADNKS